MKGYLVLDLSITDLDGLMQYITATPHFIEKRGGRYVIQRVEPKVMEGNCSPERLVILAFSRQNKAKAFLADPETQALFANRHQTTQSPLILASGC